MAAKNAPSTAKKVELHENTLYQMQLEILKFNPLKNIIDLAGGKPIPGITAPTSVQVEAANYALLRRIMPELKSITVKTQGGSGDDSRDAVGRLLEFIGQVAALRASGGTLPPLLDQPGAAQPAQAAD